jgi:hypothetical protein
VKCCATRGLSEKNEEEEEEEEEEEVADAQPASPLACEPADSSGR